MKLNPSYRQKKNSILIMKTSRLLFLALLLVSTCSVFSQNSYSQQNKAQSELNRRGEIYFNFSLSDLSQLQILGNKISIDKISGNTIYAYANAKEFDFFLTTGIDYTVLTAPSELIQVQMTDDPNQVLTWNYYPTYSAYESLMQQFATNYPDRCKLITITTLLSGRKIYALKISDNIDIQENEPEFLYSSSIHGDETTGYILLLHLADYLLSAYDSDPRIKSIVDNFEIVLCPLANPDGTYYGGNNSVNGARRYNINNVDLNRNYPDPKAGQHPDGNAWQPETIAFMNFAGENTFTMGANFHGGEEVLNYPWDTWVKLAADNAWWVYTSREYVDTVHLHSPSSYMNGFNNGITNGNAWYEITGGRQDYMNFFRYCRESTIEVSDTKLVPENQLIPHWNYNYRSMLNYIEQSGYGLHGVVTDSMSGAPLKAKVFINGFDKDSSYVYSDPDVGDYHRLLKAGMYNVTYSASGYKSKTFQVMINDKNTTIKDVQLYDGRLETNFAADSSQTAVDKPVQFSDLSAGYPITRSWTFYGGTPSTSNEINPIVTYSEPGTYAVKLVVTRVGAIDSLVKEDYIIVQPWYFMGDKTYTVCDAKYFDAGGPNNNYSNNESSVITFLPATSGLKIRATFNQSEIEDGGNDCANDKLIIYDGASENGSLLATLCGVINGNSFTASNNSGALTFKFVSNSDITANGWDVTLECVNNVGLEENNETQLSIYPNPVSNNVFYLKASKVINKVVLTDISGRKVFETTPKNTSCNIQCNWPSGFYILNIETDNQRISRKLHILN